jgi:hypothetical protein
MIDFLNVPHSRLSGRRGTAGKGLSRVAGQSRGGGTPCTLHPTPFALHPTRYLLHPDPTLPDPTLLPDPTQERIGVSNSIAIQPRK